MAQTVPTAAAASAAATPSSAATASPSTLRRRSSTSSRLVMNLLQQATAAAASSLHANTSTNPNTNTGNGNRDKNSLQYLHATPSSSSSSSSSLHGSPATELNVEELENFVTLTLSQHLSEEDSNNEEDEDEDNGEENLAEEKKDTYPSLTATRPEELTQLVGQLAEHYRALGHRLCHYQQQFDCPHCCKLLLLVNALEKAIEATPDLPATITADVHSYIGLILYKHGDFTSAIAAFLKALWIHSSSVVEDNTIALKMAMTEHRLGLSYGKRAKFDNAVKLLEKAIHEYRDKAHISVHCELYLSAKQALQDYTEARDLALSLQRQKQQQWNTTNNNSTASTTTSTTTASTSTSTTTKLNDHRNKARATSLMIPTTKPLPGALLGRENSKRRFTFHGNKQQP